MSTSLLKLAVLLDIIIAGRTDRKLRSLLIELKMTNICNTGHKVILELVEPLKKDLVDSFLLR